MQKYSEFTESYFSGPAQFLVYFIQIQILPHFDLIVGIGRDVINTSTPFVFAIPSINPFFSPSALDQC